MCTVTLYFDNWSCVVLGIYERTFLVWESTGKVIDGSFSEPDFAAEAIIDDESEDN